MRRGSGPWGSASPGDDEDDRKSLLDLNELLRKGPGSFGPFFKSGIPGGNGQKNKGTTVGIILLITLVVWGLSGLYRVESDELGVGLVFGKISSIAAPGLNYNWPYPIGRVHVAKVLSVRETNIGARTIGSPRGSQRDVVNIPEERQMLTGDENLVDVDFKVQWDVKNAPDYLFNIFNPEGTVKAVAESAMREVVGRSDIQRIITEDRRKVETLVQALMQQILDKYKSGIQIRLVQMHQVDPPDQVIDAFRDVQAARIDAERLQNEAQAEANRIIPEARGMAFAKLEEAKAYQRRVVEEAHGQASRFLSVYREYRKAPLATRERLYLETMEKVLSGADKVFIEEGTDIQGYFPIDLLRTPRNTNATRLTNTRR